MPEPQEKQKPPWERFKATTPATPATPQAGPWDKYKPKPETLPKPSAGVIPAAAPPVTSQAKPQATPQQPTYGQSLDIEAQREMEAISRFRPRWDNPQEILKDPTWYGRSTKYLGGELVGVGKAGATMAVGGAKLIHDIASALDPFESSRPLGEPQAEVGKDIAGIATGIVDLGKVTWDLLRHFPEADADPERLSNTITNLAALVDGGMKMSKAVAENMAKSPKVKITPVEAVEVAHRATTKVPSRLLQRKAFEDAYVHSKGLEVAKKVVKAAKGVQEEVALHADGIAKEIDTKIPTGVISAADEAAIIKKEFADVVKTPDKFHPALAQMVNDAAKVPPKFWSWEKARQFRSSVGRAIGKTEGPQKAVLTKVYLDLTKKLAGAAKQYGLEKSWNQYNELASKMDKEFGDIVDSVRDSQSGQEVGQRLGKDIALTSELSRNLSKYGLKHQEILDFVKTSKRIAKSKDFLNRSIFRLVYGSPTGFATAMSLRMSGAPYIAAMGGGFLTGIASANLVNLVRVLRLSPDIIESMMKERELPGRMKFEPGTFPSGEEPGVPPQLPEPPPSSVEPEIERLRRLSGGAKEPPPKTPEELKEAGKRKPTKEEEERAEALIKGRTTKASTKTPEVAKASPEERWYRDKGAIPGEPVEFLDVRSGNVEDLDKAKVAIVEHETPKGPKFEAMTSEGKSLGTFESMEEAKQVAEAKYTKAAPGEHGTGRLANQAKARTRAAKLRKEKGPTAAGGGGLEITGGGAAEKAQLAKEAAQARASAAHFDVTKLQIPEMEEHLRAQKPNSWKEIQKMRKAQEFRDDEYKAVLEWYVLHDLEEE